MVNARTKFSSQEKREFFRLDFEKGLKFTVVNSAKGQKAATGASLVAEPALERAKTKNISSSGILFQMNNKPPKLSSIVLMQLDIRTLKICQEIEKRALILEQGVVGRVVRVEESGNSKNRYDVGVCFLTEKEKSNVL